VHQSVELCVLKVLKHLHASVDSNFLRVLLPNAAVERRGVGKGNRGREGQRERGMGRIGKGKEVRKRN
jgi:hypothetical protein